MLRITFDRADCVFMQGFVEKELTDIGAQVTFACVGIFPFVTETFCFVKHSCRAEIEKCFDDFVIRRVKLLPDFFQRPFCDISDYDSAAGSAENIAVGVDMYSL